MNEELFRSLLSRMENETLDFKRSHYKLSDENSMLSFVKDVIAMANTPRDEASYIVLGVAKNADGTFELIGLDQSDHIDDADLRQQFNDRVAPIPHFQYHIVEFEEKQFGVIEILPIREGPCLPIVEKKGRLERWAWYFRRGSRNEQAKLPNDVAHILQWFGVHQYIDTPESGNPVWDNLLNKLDNFNPSRHYVLFSATFDNVDKEILSSLGLAPWVSVVDFDPESDTKGLLSSAKSTIEVHRSLHRLTNFDRPTLNLNAGTYWYFARGLSGRSGVVLSNDWRTWKQSQGLGLSDHIQRLAQACSPKPITVVVAWYSDTLTKHLRSALESIIESVGSASEIVVVTDNPTDIEVVADDVQASLFNMSIRQFCAGLLSRFHAISGLTGDLIQMPSTAGVPISISSRDFHWISEEIDLVHLNTGLVPEIDRNIGVDFLRGDQISWYELNVRYDVDRDKFDRILRQVQNDLQRRRTVRINLYHAPGSGGTTLGRRIVWDIHRSYPCAILHRTTPSDTAERLFRLTSLTESPVLLLIDGSEIAERQVNELYDFLRSRQIPVTILQVLRRFSEQKEDIRSYYLPTLLTNTEANRFVHIYSQVISEKQNEVHLIPSAQEQYKSAFYFGLFAFQDKFLGIDAFVRFRLSQLTDVQKKIIGFLAVSYYYGQQPLPSQIFADLLGVPRTRIIDLTSILPRLALDMIVQVQRGVWRTTHILIAGEVLQQLLWPFASDRRNWLQNLSTWAIEFIDLCRGEAPLPSNEMLELIRRVFIYRDNVELLGTERAGNRQFSQLVEDICRVSDEGALEVLRKVTETYPNEGHFWAHLGRFLSNKLRRFPEARDAIDKAIALDVEDAVLHHMRGMVIRHRIYQLLEENADLADIIIMAKDASISFELAREFSPDNDHGYISEVQMLIRLLDFAGKQHSDGVSGYLSSRNADPYLRDCFERSEELLERVRRGREGQGSSKYEEDCRAQLDALYGRFDRALQIWDNLLSRPDVYKPPVSRQIVWTYLARAGRSWDNITQQNAERMVDLLEESFRQEPGNDTNLRLWIQAIRRLNSPPSLDTIIERVSYWRANANSLDASYYLYVLYLLQALEGSVLASESALRFIEECRSKARLRRNRTRSFEWLGKGSGVSQLVHHSQLGDWKQDKEFWENIRPLTRAKGRIVRIDSEQSGQIEIANGVYVFFVPVRSGFRRNFSENTFVDFYLGFSYDGPRAWDVKDI